MFVMSIFLSCFLFVSTANAGSRLGFEEFKGFSRSDRSIRDEFLIFWWKLWGKPKQKLDKDNSCIFIDKTVTRIIPLSKISGDDYVKFFTNNEYNLNEHKICIAVKAEYFKELPKQGYFVKKTSHWCHFYDRLMRYETLVNRLKCVIQESSSSRNFLSPNKSQKMLFDQSDEMEEELHNQKVVAGFFLR